MTEIIKVTCARCGGTGSTELGLREVREVMANCRKPGSTNNERDAAAWIELLLEKIEAPAKAGQ
jgi:uncharacterized Zn finger protein